MYYPCKRFLGGRIKEREQSRYEELSDYDAGTGLILAKETGEKGLSRKRLRAQCSSEKVLAG